MHDFAIPNLSVPYAQKEFSAYILGDPSRKQYCSSPKVACDFCPIQYPVAAITELTNIRIRQQTGTFVAFPLHSNRKVKDSSLDAIQEHHLKEEKCKTPYLYKIEVYGQAINELTDWLMSAGMQTFRVYPELNFLGEYVKYSLQDLHK